jgi:ribosomal protein L13E
VRINLQVPYRDKDHARRLGARWDNARRVWYVENVENIGKFLRWLPERMKHLTQPHKAQP